MPYTPEQMRDMATLCEHGGWMMDVASLPTKTAIMLRQGADAMEALAAKDAEIARLNAEVQSRRQDTLDAFVQRLQSRQVEDACAECGGWGCREYSSTALWRGGFGGQAITLGACDRCWGSGDKHRPWLSHREHQDTKFALATERAKVRELREWLITDRDMVLGEGTRVADKLYTLGLTGEEPT